MIRYRVNIEEVLHSSNANHFFWGNANDFHPSPCRKPQNLKQDDTLTPTGCADVDVPTNLSFNSGHKCFVIDRLDQKSTLVVQEI